MATISVRAGTKTYDVQIGSFGPEDVAIRLADVIGSASGVACLLDATVARQSDAVDRIKQALFSRYEKVESHLLPSGEEGKTISAFEDTLEWLASCGFDRDAVVVAIGGGATSDHAGFAAASYLRGVRFAICPTTVLAMADASIGGKTGINLSAGKNLAGAIYQPVGIVSDLTWLRQLPRDAWAAGYAEIVKCALIANGAVFEQMESMETSDFFTEEGLAPLLEMAVRVKADVVMSDERETGRRRLLNFGHTYGHGFETASGYTLSHGASVALGICAALDLGVRRGYTQADLLARATGLLDRLGLPVDWKRRFTLEVAQLLSSDKKRVGDAVRFVFVRKPGESFVEEVPLKDLA